MICVTESHRVVRCRNFRSRNDGNKQTMNFLASPSIVTAMAFSNKLSFNPLTDTLLTPAGKTFKFRVPKGSEFPPAGFEHGNIAYYPEATPRPQGSVQISISPKSDRLQLLAPFPSHFGPHNPRGLELPTLTVLLRVRGKCTTDHISAAGPWLKYKGHLENISHNLRKDLELNFEGSPQY